MAQEPSRESTFVRNVACDGPKGCGSTDNGGLYSNGWAHCFGCGENWKPEGDYEGSVGSIQRKSSMDQPMITGEYRPLQNRGISEEVCKRYNYAVGVVPKDYPAKRGTALYNMRGQTVQIENYYDDKNTLIAQKLRDKDKNFVWVGDSKAGGTTLFGRHVVKAGSSHTLVITEGAIDTLSYAEMRKNWPVVSIANGAQSAAKALKANLPFLESFDKVVICFDNDDAGRDAAETCKGILSPKKMHIASLPNEYKDLNEALQAGDIKAALTAVMNAEEVKPDGIVSVDDVLEEAMRPVEMGLPWFIPELTDLTYGRRYGEVYGLGAGTGIGKTDFLTEQIAYDITVLNQPVGTFFLEQKPTETVKRTAGKVADRRFHVPDAGWTVDELKEACKKLSGKMLMYDSFGQTDWVEVKSRIRHMAVADGIRIFYVDHLTAMAESSNERESIEQIMKELAGLANELSIIIVFVSHLATPDGTPHEEGGRVAIRHFKGSRSIGFWSYFMFGLERDQQDEDEAMRHVTTFRVLKDRYTGQATGHTFDMGYDSKSGRIIPPSALDFPTDQPSDKDEEF